MRFLIAIILLVFPFMVQASEMSSPEYRLELEQIEASDEANLSSIRPEVALKLREKGYFISHVNEHPFTFTIKNTVVDIEKENETKSVYTAVRSEENFNYHISAFQWTPLQSNTGDQIPASKCTQNSCTGGIGWGYRVQGPDVPSSTQKNTYIPFSLQKRTLLSQNPHAESARATELEFKIMKDKNSSELYESIIQLLAIPAL